MSHESNFLFTAILFSVLFLFLGFMASATHKEIEHTAQAICELTHSAEVCFQQLNR